MDFAGIKVPDTALVRDAIDLSRSLLEPFLFNHVMRCVWQVPVAHFGGLIWPTLSY